MPPLLNQTEAAEVVNKVGKATWDSLMTLGQTIAPPVISIVYVTRSHDALPTFAVMMQGGAESEALVRFVRTNSRDVKPEDYWNCVPAVAAALALLATGRDAVRRLALVAADGDTQRADEILAAWIEKDRITKQIDQRLREMRE